MSRFVYVNGQFRRRNAASVHIEDRGFQFGDSVYEVIFVRNSLLIDEQEHIERLSYSLGEIGVDLPKSSLTISLLIHELMRLNGLRNGLVYLQVSRGVAPRDHLIPSGLTPSFIIMTRSVNLEKKASLRDGVPVITVPDIRWRRCDIKTTQLLANCMAKSEAVKAGAGEAWMVDQEGVVTEGSSSNAWIVTNQNRLITRPPTHDILNGITRRTLIKIANRIGVPFDERPFSLEEAKTASEAFFS
ncbi:MAG: aminotransferase class IV, partial [Proteobacteria bacterium]|nr:aminotransferase class IV [Pseudomonadota bacterium]